MIEETCDWVRTSSSTQLTTVQSLMVIGLVEVEIQRFFCHVALREYMMKGAEDLTSETP